MRLCAGQSTPTKGVVTRSGPVSWPIGDPTPLRSVASGEATVAYFSSVYGLNPDDVFDYVLNYCRLSAKDLARPMRELPFVKFQKFALALALLPNFDIYLAEGSLIVAERDFSDRWLADFRARVEGKVFILVTSQRLAVRQLCDAALVLRDGKVFMTREVDRAIDLYGLRPVEYDAPELESSQEDADDPIG